MGIVSIPVGQAAYPAALTVSAAVALTQRYGTMKAVLETLQAKDLNVAVKDGLDIVAELMKGGAAHQKMMGQHAEQPPTAEVLRATIFPWELPAIRSAAIRAVVAGLQRQVEVEEDRKNADATQGP